MTNDTVQSDLKYSQSVGNYSSLTGYGVGNKLTDLESNLKLLNFPLTNNPSKKYAPRADVDGKEPWLEEIF